MNKATEEYLELIQRAHDSAMRDVIADNDPSAYYPCMTGALRAMLGMEIERRFGESIDSTAEREQADLHNEARRETRKAVAA